jgi:hypothetical protein
MVLVLHDWPAYGRNGNRRQAVNLHDFDVRAE